MAQSLLPMLLHGVFCCYSHFISVFVVAAAVAIVVVGGAAVCLLHKPVVCRSSQYNGSERLNVYVVAHSTMHFHNYSAMNEK